MIIIRARAPTVGGPIDIVRIIIIIIITKMNWLFEGFNYYYYYNGVCNSPQKEPSFLMTQFIINLI